MNSFYKYKALFNACFEFQLLEIFRLKGRKYVVLKAYFLLLNIRLRQTL